MNLAFGLRVVLVALIVPAIYPEAQAVPIELPLVRESQVISIATAHSVLTLSVAEDGRLSQLGYGAAAAAAPRRTPGREHECYPASGSGFILEPAHR